MREEINHPLERGGRGEAGGGKADHRRRVAFSGNAFLPTHPSMICPIVRPPLRRPSIRVQGLGSEFVRGAPSHACMQSDFSLKSWALD